MAIRGRLEVLHTKLRLQKSVLHISIVIYYFSKCTRLITFREISAKTYVSTTVFQFFRAKYNVLYKECQIMVYKMLVLSKFPKSCF